MASRLARNRFLDRVHSIARDVYSIDASVGTLTRWTTSEVNFNPETALPPPELVDWKSADGVSFRILYPPRGEVHRPEAGR